MEIIPGMCMGRRSVLNPGEAERNWTPHVYRAFQCDKAPITDSDLCSGCMKRASKGLSTSKYGWQGRVDDMDLTSMPVDSHIAGSTWFLKRLDRGQLKYRGVTVFRIPEIETGSEIAALKEENRQLREQLADMKNDLDSVTNAADERGRLLKEQREDILKALGILTI